MSDWLTNKGAGPWDFTPQTEKPCYNEGDRIRCKPSEDSAVWSMDENGVTPITPFHGPCGYWWKGGTTPVVTPQGILFATGTNLLGAWGNGTTDGAVVWRQVDTRMDYVGIVNGMFHSIALTQQGEVWGSGDNGLGQLGDYVGHPVLTRSKIMPDAGWAQVACGPSFSCLLRADGTMWGAGHNYNGQLGLGYRSLVSPYIVPTFTLSTVAPPNIVRLAASVDGLLLLTASGDLYAAGYNTGYSFGLPNNDTYYPTPTLIASGVRYMTGSFHRTQIIKTDNTLWSVGFNYYGELGINVPSSIQQTFTQETHFFNDWVKVHGGVYHSAALRADGTVWTTGLNDDSVVGWGPDAGGQLGQGDRVNRQVFTQMGSASDWIDVVCGAFTTFALKADGTVWCTGGLGARGTNNAAPMELPQPGVGVDGLFALTGDNCYSHFNLPSFYEDKFVLKLAS